ncbi:MAG: ATP-binding protein [Sandaracinus sp.]
MAYRAMQNGFDALFVTCAELIEELSTAGRDGALRDALARFVKHVLVVDEVGYLAYGDDAANVLYHVVNERHIEALDGLHDEQAPKALGPVLRDLAEAIVDRILDRGRLLHWTAPRCRTEAHRC